jgi:hypothetical protein
MPARGASRKQGHDVEPSPSPSISRRGDVSVIIYKTSRARLQEEEGGVAPGLPSSWFFLFLLFSLSHIPQVLPLVYKREGWAPHLGNLFKLLGFGDFEHSEGL